MFIVTIPHLKEGVPALVLKTQSRKLARAAYELGEENKLVVRVVEEVKPREVKFRGLD